MFFVFFSCACFASCFSLLIFPVFNGTFPQSRVVAFSPSVKLLRINTAATVSSKIFTLPIKLSFLIYSKSQSSFSSSVMAFRPLT